MKYLRIVRKQGDVHLDLGLTHTRNFRQAVETDVCSVYGIDKILHDNMKTCAEEAELCKDCPIWKRLKEIEEEIGRPVTRCFDPDAYEYVDIDQETPCGAHTKQQFFAQLFDSGTFENGKLTATLVQSVCGVLDTPEVTIEVHDRPDGTERVTAITWIQMPEEGGGLPWQ